MSKSSNKSQKVKSSVKKAKKVQSTNGAVSGLNYSAVSRLPAIVEEDAEVFDMACKLVQGLLDPESISDKVTFPFLTETVHLVFPKVVCDVNCLNSDGEGRFLALVRPTVYGALHCTDVNVVPNTNLFGSRQFLGAQYADVTRLTPKGRWEEETPFCCRIGPEVGEVFPQIALATPETDICLSEWNGQAWEYFPKWVGKGNGVSNTLCVFSVGYQLSIARTVTTTAHVRFSTKVGTDWVAAGTVIGSAASTLSSGLQSFTVSLGPHTDVRIDSFYITTDFNLGAQVMSVSLDVGTSVFTAESSDAILYAKNSDLAPQIEDIGERCVCLSSTLWFKWFGSTLENGGSVAGFRCPKNYPITQLSGTPEKVYNRLKTLPRTYLGRAEQGAYGYWVPADRWDLGPRGIHDTRPNSAELVLAGDISNPDQSMVFEYRSIMIVTTISQIFAPRFLHGCDRSMELAMMMLSQITCFTCNPSHSVKIRRVLDHLYEHRGKVKAGAVTALKAAKILAPVIASLL